MPKFPFTYNYSTARAYYGPSLQDPITQPQAQWINQPQIDPYKDINASSNLATMALVGGGVFASGFIPFRGKRLWNYYVPFFRGIEEYSPGQILRTFQVSSFLSQFQKHEAFRISPSVLSSNQVYAHYLSHVLGSEAVTREGKTVSTFRRLLQEGLTVKGSKAYWGVGEEVALKYASLLTVPEGASSYFGSGFARTIGADYLFEQGGRPLAHAFFAAKEPTPGVINPFMKIGGTTFPAQVIGARNLPEYMWRQAGAWGTEWVSRFNRLLRAPFEIEPFRTVFGGVQKGVEKVTGKRIAFHVAETGGAKMLGRLALKYGLYGGAIALGYQSIDHALRNAEVLDSTLFAEGLTAAGAILAVKANLITSEISESLGLHKYREMQEEIAPGSTDLGRLLAFPLIGAFGAGTSSYILKTYLMARNQIKGYSAVAARELTEETMKTFGGKGILAQIGRQLTTKEGIYAKEGLAGDIFRKIASVTSKGKLHFKGLGVIGPTKLAALAGATIGAALVLPFLPGALIPGTRSEELRAIYSGEKEVPIRKGRWWEFGRCLMMSNTYETTSGDIKTSNEIEIGDVLRGRDGDPAEVLAIYRRHHKGDMYIFSTAHDRDIKTGTTGNHIIPVFYKGIIREVEARHIKVNDYVEVPFKPLSHSRRYIYPANIILDPVVLENGRLFATQKNWFTGGLQKSGTTSIPDSIELDEDIGLLMGYFLAEGNISFNKNNPTVIETVHAKSEKWIVDDIIRICTNKFDLTPTVRFKTTGKKTKEGCWVVRICSAILSKLFRYLFYPGNYDAYHKVVPKQVMSGPESFKVGLIEGYYRGDGYWDGAKVISSARKHLLEDIQLIALNLGEACGISPKEENEHHGRWKLRFYHSEATNPGSIFYMGRLFSRIRSIEIEDYDDTVYDFEVNHPDHLLQAGTFLVHNSPWEGCLTPESFLVTSDGGLNKAANIKMGEKLINKCGQIVEVLAVKLREADEKVYRPVTSYDQSGLVSITGNHNVLQIWCPYYFKPGKCKPQKRWTPIENVAVDGRSRLFIPYYTPSDILDSIRISDVTKYEYTDGQWFVPVKSMWTCEMDQEVIAWGNLPPKSKMRELKKEHIKQEYNVTSSQIRYRLNDLRKVKENGTCIRRRPISGPDFDDVKLSYDLGLFCGFYAAEGSVGDNTISFALHRDEKDYIRNISKIGWEIFGLNTVVIPVSDNGVSVSFNGGIASDFIEWMIPGKVKDGSKRINSKIFDAPTEFVLGFIEGVIKGDGSIKEGAVRVGMRPCPLLRQIQLLLSRLHIFSALSKEFLTREGYRTQELRIPKASSYKLNQLIELKDIPPRSLGISKRQCGYIELEDGFAVTIFDIERESYQGVVYDFEVESGESFVGPGFTMHNSRIMYYRPHWYPRMLMRAREKAIWGENEPTPLEKFYTREFTYDLEKKFYEERPYPISSIPFEDIPLVGPLLASTIGRLIKPARLMHTEEWLSDKGVRPQPPNFGERIATELGQEPGGIPISPYGLEGTVGEQIYRMTEMVGLPGFAMVSMKEKLTGSQDTFDQFQQLESARRIAGFERYYWDLELGGLLGATEAWRRLFPHRRRQIPLYNPIRNTLPCLLPETEVLMASGRCKRADEVKVGDFVVSQNGNKAKVLEVSSFPAHEIIDIKLYGDNLHTLRFSWNHPLLISDHSFKNAADIYAGDYVAFPIRPYSKTGSEIIDLSRFLEDKTGVTNTYIYYGVQSNNALENDIAESFGYKIKDIPLSLKQEYPKLYDICRYRFSSKRPKQYKRISRFWKTEEFFYLVGVYAAEGSWGKKNYSFKLSGHINDKWESRILDIFERNDVTFSIERATTGTGQNIISSCVPISRILQYLCPGSARTKYLNEDILDRGNSLRSIIQLITGLIDGDGYYCLTSGNRVKCGLRTTSNDLAYQFRNLIIDSLQLVPAITLGTGAKNKSAIHVALSGIDANKLAQLIGYKTVPYHPKQDNRKYKVGDSHVYIKVRTVSSIAEDCNVIGHKIDGDHTFCVSLIATHNTWLPGAGERSPDFLHGDPYCVSGDTLIETLRGFSKASELKSGPTTCIKTHTGKWAPVKTIVKRQMRPNECLFEIRVASLAAFPVKASEGHPFWTPDGWKEAKDLEIGDYVGYPIKCGLAGFVQYKNWICDLEPYIDFPVSGDYIYMYGTQEYADCVNFIENHPASYAWGKRKKILDKYGWDAKTFENAQRGLRYGTIKRIPSKFNMGSKEWGIIAGYYLSEGFTDEDSVCFAFHKNETEYHEEVLRAFKVLWGLDGHIYPASKGDGCTVQINNRALASFIPQIFGKGFSKKRILSSEESIPDLLRCLFNGGGSFFFDDGKPCLALKLENLQLLLEVREILLKYYNCVGYIVENQLKIRGQAAKDLALKLGCKYKECIDSSRTARHTYIKDGYVWMRIFAKKEVPQEPVYGIEVDDPDSSFCVVGIATHNTRIPEGELRLPGPGYAIRYPELKGVAPSEYPLIHKYKILSDVAPYSDKYKQIVRAVRAKRNTDEWTDYDEKLYQQTKEQLQEKKESRIELEEYRYLPPTGTGGEEQHYAGEESSSLIAALNKRYAEQREGEKGGVFSRIFGSYWEMLAHNAETSLDVITPISPAAKLVHVRSPIESYERQQVWGTESAFWQHPWRDFLRPFTQLTARSLGWSGIPGHIERKREIEEYFDVLKYAKYARLSNMARMAGDSEAVKEFESKKDETLFGINPFTRNYTSVFRSLPRRDRDYFNAFSEASTVEERQKILGLVPENERALYIARWKLAFAEEVKKAKKAGALSEDQLAEADEIIEGIYDEARNEGFPSTKELFQEYLETKLSGENYADWYRRTKLLPEYPLPGPDWVGWCPSTDLEDLKLKVVQNLAEDMHEYNLWPSRLQQMAYKPYINEEAIAPIMNPEQLTDDEMRDRIDKLFFTNEMKPRVFKRTTFGAAAEDSLDIDIEQKQDLDSILTKVF